MKIISIYTIPSTIYFWLPITLLCNSIATAQGKIILNRDFAGKEIQFEIDQGIEDGFTKVIWEESPVPDKFNQVVQIAPTVLLYREYLPELKETSYGQWQPTFIEFLDSSFQSITMIDIWQNRPFQDTGNISVTYYHFNAEGIELIPYEKQIEQILPSEYSIFTDVYCTGHHVIVSFRQLHISNYLIYDQKSYIRVFDLKGNLVTENNMIPTIDNVVISPKGAYMMYLAGGSWANVNQPFASLENASWGIIDIHAKQVLFHEVEKEGTHLDGIFFTQGLLHSNSTTPFDKIHYDYDVFFNEETQTLYKKFWTQAEWDQLKEEYSRTKNKDWRYYLEKYGFEKIKLK